MKRWSLRDKPYLIYAFISILLISSIKYGLETILFEEYRFSILSISINFFTLSLFFILLLFFMGKLRTRGAVSERIQKMLPIFSLSILFPFLDRVDMPLSLLHLSNHGLYDPYHLLNNSCLPGIILVFFVSLLLFVYKSKEKMVSQVMGIAATFIAFSISLAPFLLTYSLEEFIVDFQGSSREIHLILICVLIAANLLAVSLAYYDEKKDEFLSLIQNLKLFRTVHFMIMVIIGILVVRRVAPGEALYLSSVHHIPYIILPVLCMALTWQFTAIVNDYYDIRIDELVHPDRPLVSGQISVNRYLQLAAVAAGISALTSSLIGGIPFLLNLSFIAAALFYSVPPIRLKSRIFGYVCVGWASVVAFLSGVYSPTVWRSELHWFSPSISRNIPFSPDIASIAMILFSVLSISPYINAISDYEGDKEGGVKSLYTIYGFEKGKKIVSVLILFLFLAPLLLINSMFDMAILIAASISSSLIFYYSEKYQAIFGIYFLVLIYVLARFLGLISF